MRGEHGIRGDRGEHGILGEQASGGRCEGVLLKRAWFWVGRASEALSSSLSDCMS